MAAVVVAILASQELHGTDLGEAEKNGEDLLRLIRAANIIKRFFRSKKIGTRLDHRLLTERVKFDADLLRGLGRLLVQICLFCFLIQVCLFPRNNGALADTRAFAAQRDF